MIKNSHFIIAFFCLFYISNCNVNKEIKVVDGDTIRINSEKIRLHGIDAPEIKQICIDNKGKEYKCGIMAKQFLEEMIGVKKVTCKKRGNDRYRRSISVCYVGRKNINRMMVRLGWAVAFRRYSTDYVEDEQVARNKLNGIWSGQFIMPWLWRRSN